MSEKQFLPNEPIFAWSAERHLCQTNPNLGPVQMSQTDSQGFGSIGALAISGVPLLTKVGKKRLSPLVDSARRKSSLYFLNVFPARD